MDRMLVIGERTRLWPYDGTEAGLQNFEYDLPSRLIAPRSGIWLLETAQLEWLAQQPREHVLYHAFVMMEERAPEVWTKAVYQKVVFYSVWFRFLQDIIKEAGDNTATFPMSREGTVPPKPNAYSMKC